MQCLRRWVWNNRQEKKTPLGQTYTIDRKISIWVIGTANLSLKNRGLSLILDSDVNKVSIRFEVAVKVEAQLEKKVEDILKIPYLWIMYV